MFESKSGVLLVAGLGFFALAFVSNGLVPMLMYSKDKFPERTAEQEVNPHLVQQVRQLIQHYPEPFQKHLYGDLAAVIRANAAAYPQWTELDPANAEDYWRKLRFEDQQTIVGPLLREGRKAYIAEACWHCHSQFVRPVSNEERRWGPVSKGWEYQNELQRPVMFGTRRVGPDLSREGGRHGNDWHFVHLFKPKMTSPQSVMPDYPWFFDNGDDGRPSPGNPNRKGMALVLYMQWLGSWLDTYPHYNLNRSEGADRP